MLDGAAAEWQIRALQPAIDRTAVVVTSRRSLAGLEQVERLPLDRLPAGDAQRMLAAVIPPGQADEADLIRLARLCDHVPLALRIAANRVASRPGSTAAALVERLGVRSRRLDALTAGDLRMQSAIRSSVDELTPATRQLFRRLALLPRPTFAADHAAAVVDEPRWRTADMLEELAELNLVHTAPGDRYAMDDLFRLNAEDELAAREPLTARVLVQARCGDGTTPAQLPPARDPARRASLGGRRRLVPQG